ncbi:MAG: bifunctional riboflavin kinase/FAD synthetase [Bacteroidetes bacterium]|nr:MAG: bifunctional riboflavin kinase/FAD synthetase [Bacteroidota bacterium]
MNIYHHLKDFHSCQKTVVTTGTFDGVHLGHRKILSQLVETAKKKNFTSVLLTFSPHPRLVLYPDNNDLKLLTTDEEKIELLKQSGVENLIIHPFTREFAKTSSLDFIKTIIAGRLNAAVLIIGYDHRFGKGREGSFEHLKEYAPVYGFEVVEIPPQDVDSVNISSTKIRKALSEGDISTANKYLGYAYFISGKVIKGSQIGTQIGFPTANIFVENPYKLIPKNGVYCVNVEINGRQKRGMLNIGTTPTVSDSKHQKIEVHIFDFNEDIYNQKIKVSFIARIRNEKKFESIEALLNQLNEDRLFCLNQPV